MHLNFAVALAVSLTVVRFASGISRDYESGVHSVPGGFTTAVVSWDVRTPNASWIETLLRAKIGDRWTHWYEMGHWANDLSSGHRHSVKAPRDTDGQVNTDTLVLDKPANAWQVRVLFHLGAQSEVPALSLLAVTTGQLAPSSAAHADRTAWGVDIHVPERTQHVDESPRELGGGGEAWCSPTSVSMIMAYWSVSLHHPEWNIDVPSVAKGTYDPVYDGCGNWPFNVAFASEHGLQGWVERLHGLDDAQKYVSSGIPLVASIKVAAGELDGSPYKETEGHLLVVRGFTATGDVIANDPAGRHGHIRIVYKRAQFEHVWMKGSDGIVYVIAPPDVLRKVRAGLPDASSP